MSVVKNKLLTKGYSVIYTDSVIDAMLDKGIDSVKGARGLSQIRREMIEDRVADIIINTPPPRGTIFHLNYEDDLVLNLNKPKKQKEVKNDK
jgi:ATP-dependent Clp protease ATP-binding subunit ClpA